MSILNESIHVEEKSFSLLKIIFTIFSIIAIRIFLDNLAYPNTGSYFFPTERFIQEPLYFFSLFFSFSLLTYFLTKSPFTKILPFITRTFLFILIVPIIDLILSGSQIEALKYITVTSDELFVTFFKTLNPLRGQGITIGQHFAVYGILITIGVFSYKETSKKIRSALAVVLGYAILFFYATIPSIIVSLGHGLLPKNLNATDSYNLLLKQSWLFSSVEDTTIFEKLFFQINSIHEIFIARFFWLLLLAQIAVIFFISNKNTWTALKKDLRISRIFYWFIIASIGIILNQKLFGDINLQNPINSISILTFLLLIVLNIWLAVFINDSEDVEIDKISNQNRPLIAKTISNHDWNLIQIVIFILIGLGTITMNKSSAALLIMAQASYYIYSSQPLRLKKHFVFSSILTGIAAVFISMAGFFLVSPDQHIFAFPVKAMLIIGVFYALLSNIKDIKDFNGDKKEGILTIPVVFDLKASKYIIATLYSIVIISLPFILKKTVMIFPSFCISIFLFYLFTKKEYQEKYIFLVFFLYMATFYLVIR